VVRRLGPRKVVEDVEFATLEWAAWFNSRRLLEPLGCVPPIESEDSSRLPEQFRVLLAQEPMVPRSIRDCVLHPEPP